jgi:hypothetical protein
MLSDGTPQLMQTYYNAQGYLINVIDPLPQPLSTAFMVRSRAPSHQLAVLSSQTDPLHAYFAGLKQRQHKPSQIAIGRTAGLFG